MLRLEPSIKVTRTYKLNSIIDTNLSDVTSVTSSAENLINMSELDFVFLEKGLDENNGKKPIIVAPSLSARPDKKALTIFKCYENIELILWPNSMEGLDSDPINYVPFWQ